MAGLGNLVTTKIITKGLGCGLPLDSGNITTHFGLFCIQVIVPPQPPINIGSGGMIPLAPGQIANLYKPIHDQVPTFHNQPVFDQPPSIHIPVGQEDNYFRKNYIVTITIEDQERIYKVSPRTGNMVVSVLNFVNSTKEKVKVTINKINIKRLSVEIANLRKSLFK